MIFFARELLAVASAFTTLQAPPAAPFRVGERAEYSVKYLLASGNGAMEVAGIDTVRGKSAMHFIFTFTGGTWGYHLRDSSQSWVDQTQFRSLRFHQDKLENGTPRIRRYEIFPERAAFAEPNKPEQPSVAEPLDDVSFIYFVRQQKLVVGQKIEYQNYFKPASNPVKLEVLRREIIEVPAGKFTAFVVRPIIKTKGIFSEGGQALMWIADDSSHVVVQLKTKLGPGTITMRLVSYRPTFPALVPRRD